MSAVQKIDSCLAQILRIGTAMVPEKNWYSIYIECHVVESITEVKSWYTIHKEGYRIEYDTFDLDYINEDANNNEIGQFVAQMRDLTANPIRGAWYMISIEFYRNGLPPIIQYNYHDKPIFSIPVPLALYKKDLKVYPRAPQHIPDWLV